MELKLQLSKPPTDVYTIQFTYADPGRAQNALREIMHELSDAALLQTLGGPSTSVGASPESSDSRELPAGVFEIVDPASLPEKPEMPNQLLGATAGLMVGLASGAFWWRSGAAIPRSFQRARTGN
jgi:hypothetical protein